MIRRFRHPSARAFEIDAILHVPSDPVRRGVMIKLLGCAGLVCSKACADLSPSTLSFHHRVLREAGLIRSE